jgi:hypothetical protein
MPGYRGPLSYEQIKLLTEIMTQTDGLSLRDPRILDYMFRDVVELIKDGVPFTFADIASLADACFKMQLQMNENHADIVFAWMQSSNSFSLMNLRQNHINTVLKLFRGFFSMNTNVLSKPNQTVLVESFCTYLSSDVTKEMNPSLWLSVIDICNRAGELHPRLKETAATALA